MTPVPAPAERIIKTLMVSTSYPADLSDWRGLFIRHLTYALARRDDLRLRLWSPPGEMPSNVDYAASAVECCWLERLMSGGGIAHLIRQRGLRAVALPMRLLLMLRAAYRRHADVSLYHINWLQNALSLPHNGKPLLVTVLGTDLQLLKLPLMRSLMRRVMRGRRVVVCPNAEWMLPALNGAFGDLAQVRFVPFGIDPAWFQIERQLPGATEPAQWLCVTRLTRAKVGPLLEWCQPFFSDGRRELHLFGPMQEQMDLPPWVHWHGPASPDTLRNNWFPRAHGFITLSRHAEGRPQVMLEALASGLPIIASNLPAHIDLLARGDCGILVESPDALHAALEALSDPAVNCALGLRGRALVQREIGTWVDCAERYVTLYRELLEQADP